ncbi:MAG TPA: DUF2723 domain-containing protein, partial [Longimicrobiales bacterium]|nr:DUF2723 domain-containing protein [Longimicrobiales bacterium]
MRAEEAATDPTGEPPATDGGQLRPPYGAAALAGALVFALYAITLAPTTAFWDTSEYIATAHILGIPHPPGNPLFVLLARTWELLLAPTGLSVAVRINLFSAFMSATAHALWFLVVHHILRYFSEDRAFRLVGAAAAVLVSATAFTVWNQSNVNEKVYTVSLLTIALLTWLAMRWQENIGRGKDDHLLVLMAFILALSVGNHLMAFLAAPAIFVLVVLVHPRALLNWRLYAAGAVAAVLGLSVHLFLPIRAGLGPVINEAAPTCPDIGSAIGAILSYGNAGCDALSEALQRTQYDKPPLLPRLAPLLAQYQNYLQYFDWQWARGIAGENTVFPMLRMPFTMLFTALGLWGAFEHAKRDRTSFWYVLTLFATVSVALVYYLNFRYGYSLPAPVQDRGLHEVRERDYFFIVSFSVWGLWAGIGIATLWRQAAEELRTTLRGSSPVLALAVVPLVLNWSWASRASDYSARDWAYNLLMSVEPYAVLFTNGDNDTFPLWYLQEVEGIRRDVTVMVTPYLRTPWYVRQIRDLTQPCPGGVDPAESPTRILCQRPFRPGDLPPPLLEAGWARAAEPPRDSIVPLSDEEIERYAGSYLVTQGPMKLRAGGLEVTVEAGTGLLPSDLVAAAMLKATLGERPIHFMPGSPIVAKLGLSGHNVRQGVTWRIHDGASPGEEEGLVPLPPSGLSPVSGAAIDLALTDTLVWEVYLRRGRILDPGAPWVDAA